MLKIPRHPLARAALWLAAAGLAVTVALAATSARPTPASPPAPSAGQAALAVSTTGLQPATFPVRIAANGSISAWQEASVGTEANGLRLTQVLVNVGDTVRRGQPLARFAAETIEAELAQSRAAVAEAEAALAEAGANARRAQVLQESGALSGQQIEQYLTAERTLQARVDAARAVERTQQLRLAHTHISAPDDGVISARTATVGAVLPAGQELFRLIRGGRLEWRAEVAAADLARLAPGQKARITLAGADAIEGRLRMLSPVVDVQTRNGLAYVDLPPGGSARAGMFARGEITLGTAPVQTLPHGAVQLRDGFSYVMRVEPDSRVTQVRVEAGRRLGNQVEITGGLQPADRVVASGVDFLGDGDLVRIVDHAAGPTPAPLAQGIRTPAAPATRIQ